MPFFTFCLYNVFIFAIYAGREGDVRRLELGVRVDYQKRCSEYIFDQYVVYISFRGIRTIAIIIFYWFIQIYSL